MKGKIRKENVFLDCVTGVPKYELFFYRDRQQLQCSEKCLNFHDTILNETIFVVL